MKKALCTVIAAALLAGAVGCANDNEIIDIDSEPVQTQTALTTDAPVSESPEPVSAEPTEVAEITDAPAPTESQTAAIVTPAPTAESQLPEGQVLRLNTMSTDLQGLSEAEAEEWFSDAVFVGDSIMLGWKNYNNNKLSTNPKFFGQTHFLCEGSYGTGHALEPVTANSLHPLYQGQQHQIWDSIQMMGAKKVFICFGLNDVAIYGVDGTAENFGKLCKNITDKTPDAKIYIISAMYLIDDSNMKALTNVNLRALNQKLRDLCNERGYGFVDIASHLVGADGYLKAEYCSDNYVHQTAAAYDIWAQVLRGVAATAIKSGN